MKILVDKMPETSHACLFSKWHPYPPIVEEPGYYECKITDKRCTLSKIECSIFKEQKHGA